MIPLQVLSVIFALFMLYIARIHHKKGHMETFEYALWAFIWVAFMFAAIFPQTFQGIAETLNISRVFDLLVIIGMMILTFLTFQNRIYFKRLEKKLENVIRKRAMDEG